MSRRTVLVLLLAALATIDVLTSCTSTSPGTPAPGTTTIDSGAQSSDPNGSPDKAPKVAHPLNASAFTSKPCTALAGSDVAALGLGGAQTTDSTNQLGPSCGWSVGNKTVNIVWQTSDTNGLSDLYALKSLRAYWIPMTIGGYPAVEADAADGRSTIGSCVANVGVNDHLFFFAGSVGAGNADQACSLAKQAAAAVVKNLQAVQGAG